MARLDPFRTTTYAIDRVSADDVVAPPYDVVSPSERAALAARSPYNAIHVELPVEEPTVPGDRYSAAAARFASWHGEGVVEVGGQPSLSLYRMTYRDALGSRRSTTGVLGALALDPEHRGDVLPHEETTPKDKRDRLSLLRAARANFSPVWGLSVAPGFGELCDEAVSRQSDKPWSAVDDEGALHERWTLDDAELIESLSAAVLRSPVLLADGHHRYETACNYLDEAPGQPGAEAMLALVVALNSQQLWVQPIHRLVKGVEPAALPRMFARWFEIESAPSADELPSAMDEANALGLLTKEASFLLSPTAALSERAGADIDSLRVAVVLDDLGITEVVYQHGFRQASEAVASDMADGAVLLRPVSVEQIADVANGGRLMPPKTTFFSPKPRTGMVFRELDPD